MSAHPIPASMREAVRLRAGALCEYCTMPDSLAFVPHEPDHIIAGQHGGQTSLDNLAFACYHCNRLKGPNISSIDPETRRMIPLFNPRTQRWSAHFRMRATEIIPLTPAGRATAALLQFNAPERVLARYTAMQLTSKAKPR